MGFLIWLPVVHSLSLPPPLKPFPALSREGGVEEKRKKSRIVFIRQFSKWSNSVKQLHWKQDFFLNKPLTSEMLLIITCASRFLNSRVLLSCSVMAARSCFSSFSIFRSWSWTRQSFSVLCSWNRCVFSCSCSSFSSTIWLDNEEYSSSIEHPCRHDNSSYSLFPPLQIHQVGCF